MQRFTSWIREAAHWLRRLPAGTRLRLLVSLIFSFTLATAIAGSMLVPGPRLVPPPPPEPIPSALPQHTPADQPDAPPAPATRSLGQRLGQWLGSLYDKKPEPPQDQPADQGSQTLQASEDGSGAAAAPPADRPAPQTADPALDLAPQPYESSLQPVGPLSPPEAQSSAQAQSEAFIYEEHHAIPPTAPKRPEPAPWTGPIHPGAKLAIVIDDLGESAAFARKLTALGVPLTMAVMPRLGETEETARSAAAAGCDVILHQPMEPKRRYVFRANSGALTMDMEPKQVRAALIANLDANPLAKGVNNHMGSRYTESAERMAVVLETLKSRGLFFLDSQTSQDSRAAEAARRIGMPIYTRDVFLDNTRSVRAILDQLRQAELTALHRGQAIAIGHPYPETLLALSIWVTQRDKRLKLARLSELTPR